MKLFFSKTTTNANKENKEDPSLIRRRQLEEDARQMKLQVRQEFQKIENNRVSENDRSSSLKFDFKHLLDSVHNSNEKLQSQLVELKRIYVEVVEDNKHKIRPKSRQWNANGNGTNTFNLTALQQSVQRPYTSQSIKHQHYSKSGSIPDYFSMFLTKNSDAVEQRLQSVKEKHELTNEEIFKEQQKQLEILKMKDELVDKDKRLREQLYALKRMKKLAESRYSNIERIEYHAAENKKHIKRNVQGAQNQLVQTQQVEEAFLEQKKQIHKELKREIILQEDLLQHNYIKMQEIKFESEEVRQELDQVIIEEQERKERENDFYIIGQNLWAIENLQKKIEQSQQKNFDQIREILDSKVTKNPEGQATKGVFSPQLNRRLQLDSPQRSRIGSQFNIQIPKTTTNSGKSTFRITDNPQISGNQHERSTTPPKLNRKEILDQLEVYFSKNGNIQEVAEMIIKEYHSIDLENQMKEIKFKTETQNKQKLTQELLQLDEQLEEIKIKNDFIEHEDDEVVSTKTNIINNFLEQDIAMDAGRMVNLVTPAHEDANQKNKEGYQTVNQTVFSTKESQRLEMLEKQVKKTQSFLVHLFLSAQEFITRIICIVQSLQEKGSDKYSTSINHVLKDISQTILGKLPNQIIPTKPEKASPSPSLVFEGNTQRSLLRSQLSMDEQIEVALKFKSSLSSLTHIEDLELIDVTTEIHDEKLRQLCLNFLENIKKSSLLKYFVQTNVVSNYLKRVSQLYYSNPELAIKRLSHFEELKQSAQLQIRIRFRQILDGFTALYQKIDKCRDESRQQIKLMKQYFSLNNSQNAPYNENKLSDRSSQNANQRKSVKFMQKIVTEATEADHIQQQKHNNKKVIDKIQNYHNSTDDDYYQKFSKMDMLNEQKRVHQEMIESEQEKKSNAIMRFISTISEKKKSVLGKTQQLGEIQNLENVKQTETADDIVLKQLLSHYNLIKHFQIQEYIDKQRQNIKQTEIDIKNQANMKKVKQKGFYSKELGFKSKPIEVYNRISKTYDKNEIEENQNIRQVAAESSLLFKIDQLDSRYTGKEEKKISQELIKEKRNKIVFYKKEFNQLSQGYLQPNKLYHRKKLITLTFIKTINFQKKFSKNQM